MCEEAGFEKELRDTVYWVALLRYVGCTGHAHEVATVFGDDIAILAETLVFDAADPAAVGHAMVAFATAGRPPEEHEQIARSLQEGAHDWAVHNFATGCEVGDMLIQRLDLGPDVREAFGFTYERWNGNGYPAGAKGEQIPLAMRVVHLSQDMEAIGRRSSPAEAIDAARERRDRTYDPELADLFVAHGRSWFDQLDKMEPWDAVLDLEPEPHRTLEGAELDEALTVAADFIDLKSPYMSGHSRRCAQLAADAAKLLGSTDDAITTLRRAALLHELGTTAVPNSILDKPGPLTRGEFDRVERHPMLTDQMLRRSLALGELSPIAAAHHEKADGSGYHRGLRAFATDRAARILAAADIYVGLTTDRADRPAFSDAAAATELRRLASQGVLEHDTADAVLIAAGHRKPRTPTSRRSHLPGGLTGREVEVLRLAARGLTTREIAERLHISPKTADGHLRHVYTKIGVSTRAAAALWAMRRLEAGRRVTRTFMFTDIVGSTDLIQTIGDEAWEDVLHWHDETLRTLFASHRGEVVHTTGDGFFASFGDAVTATSCAVAIQRRLAEHRREHGFAPPVRIGFHLAEATVIADDYAGLGVHEAARVGALADGGEILATISTVDEAGMPFEVVNEREVSLKGITQPVRVVTIDWRT
jgi:HD-GYP domain-containing protein (c-di-GMP phosphodiesterase class II)/class 3 adenylate cyclase